MDGRVSNQALVPIILTLPTPLVLCMALHACRRRFSHAPPPPYFAAVRSYWDSAFDIRSARSLHPSNRTAAAALSSRRVTTRLTSLCCHRRHCCHCTAAMPPCAAATWNMSLLWRLSVGGNHDPYLNHSSHHLVASAIQRTNSMYFS